MIKVNDIVITRTYPPYFVEGTEMKVTAIDYRQGYVTLDYPNDKIKSGLPRPPFTLNKSCIKEAKK